MRRILAILLVFWLAACGAPAVPVVTPAASATAQPVVSPPPQQSLTAPIETPVEVTPTPPGTQELLTSQAPTATPIALPALPDPASYTWQLVVQGLEKPVGLVHAGDGSGRVFILEQVGRVRILQNGRLLATPFLDITRRAGSQGSEQGLLGLAFHPNYSKNGSFFINYTDLNGDTVIARFQVSMADPNQADPASEADLMLVPQPYQNHNGGAMAFGPDGYLYLGLGDGGSAGDPQNNAQSLNSLLGKILRIDVDHARPYAIPVDNPFANGQGRPEIWAYGLRNPWRFAFDRLTGDLYIGDVGQSNWEEIDYLPPGIKAGGFNFGWNYFEGNHPYQGNAPAQLDMIPPVFEYGHDQGCSVTGGVIYRGAQLPAWQGVYLLGDYCSGRVWGLSRTTQGNWLHAVLFENVGQITSFGEDEQGEVYLVDYAGKVYLLKSK